jgi:hypothetical protein
MKNKNRFIIWLPRVLSILFVLFLMLFSVDVFESGASAGDIALGLLVHNIPALILLTAALVSWKYEIIGGVVFTLTGIIYISLMMRSGSFDSRLVPILIIAFPALVIGVLFAVNWFKKKSLYDV